MKLALAGLILIGGMQPMAASAQDAAASINSAPGAQDSSIDLGRDRITIGAGVAILPR